MLHNTLQYHGEHTQSVPQARLCRVRRGQGFPQSQPFIHSVDISCVITLCPAQSGC